MTTRTIAILGTGGVGTALARGFAARGDRVVFGTRSPDGDAARAALDAVAGATARPHADAASAADLAVVALPWSAVDAVLDADVAAALAGKTVIDAVNPLAPVEGGGYGLAVGFDDSAGERIQRALPGAHVVKAFNTITFAHMVQPKLPDGVPDMFIAGDSDAAKAEVAQVLADFGWRRPIDIGGIAQSRLLEPLAMLWITYGMRTGHWTHGFSLLGQA